MNIMIDVEGNYSLLIIGSLGCYLVGHYTGYLIRNMGDIWNRYGIILGGLLLGYGGFFMFVFSMMVAGFENTLLSIAFVYGFLYRFFRDKP